MKEGENVKLWKGEKKIKRSGRMKKEKSETRKERKKGRDREREREGMGGDTLDTHIRCLWKT